ERLEVARSLGATHTVSLTELDAEQRRELIYDLVGPHGPDVVVEAAGALPAFGEGVELCGDYGRYIVLGLWGAMGESAITPRLLTTKNMTIGGATFAKPKHYHAAMQLAARLQDRYPLAGLVTHRYGIEQAGEALQAIEHAAAIKAVIDPTI
ncbi:MAG TPA: zinc-binding dehydrogenase, partial [Baekduia sp.]|nr:zinc-binding dehydrogenase [Baekduia sp.]